MEPFNFRQLDRATNEYKFDMPGDRPLRTMFNTKGKEVQIRVNQFKVIQWPQRKVYQFDVSSSSLASVPW
jgi:hypothetical protein